jgi:hypothetical protein
VAIQAQTKTYLTIKAPRPLPRLTAAQLMSIRQAGAEAAARVILWRTAQGIDLYGKKFKPYSIGYMEWRHRHRLPINRVTLRKSGALYDSIRAIGGRVYVDSQKVVWIRAQGREFFGIHTKDEQAEVEAAMRRKLKSILGK